MERDQDHPFSRVGPALRTLRKRVGFVQQDLADRLGINKASVSRIEQSTSNPTMDTVGRYLAAVEATEQDLVDALRVLTDGPVSPPQPAPAQTHQTPQTQDPLERFRTETYDRIEESAPHRRLAFDLIDLYRTEFLELHRRLTAIEARLRDD